MWFYAVNKSSTFFSRSIDSREKNNYINLRGKPRGFEKVLDKCYCSSEGMHQTVRPEVENTFGALSAGFSILRQLADHSKNIVLEP